MSLSDNSTSQVSGSAIFQLDYNNSIMMLYCSAPGIFSFAVTFPSPEPRTPLPGSCSMQDNQSSRVHSPKSPYFSYI